MRKQAERTSKLEILLLALVSQQPRSGYEIRGVIVDTPMAHFSDSPGSVYPALKRLENRGLIRSEKEVIGRRKRQRYATTARGESVIRKWLHGPVTREDVTYHMDDLILRFAFMESQSTPVIDSFLTSMEQQLDEHVAELKKFMAGARKALPFTGRLAMESGIEGYEGSLRWVRRARKELESGRNGQA